MTEPAWLARARSYIGFHETGDNRGIEHFIEAAHTGSLGDSWCAIFANACLEEVGVHGTRSPAARSFETDSNFRRLAGPQVGCVVTLWRVSPTSGLGHVGFLVSITPDHVELLSGNDDDQVEIALHPLDRVTGYWWPASDVTTDAQPAIHTGKGSWYGQHVGKYVWHDPGDAPNSNALGVPDEQQGFALYDRATLGKWARLTAPNGKSLIKRQTDIGPHPHTGRSIDIHAVTAEEFGYTPHDFPTDSYFSWTFIDAPSTEPPVQPQLPPPSTTPPDVQVILTPEQFERLQKKAQPIVLPALNLLLGFLPQLGVWGLVATQVLAFLQAVPAVPGVSTNGPSTAVVSFLGMIVSGLISRLKPKEKK